MSEAIQRCLLIPSVGSIAFFSIYLFVSRFLSYRPAKNKKRLKVCGLNSSFLPPDGEREGIVRIFTKKNFWPVVDRQGDGRDLCVRVGVCAGGIHALPAS